MSQNIAAMVEVDKRLETLENHYFHVTCSILIDGVYNTLEFDFLAMDLVCSLLQLR